LLGAVSVALLASTGVASAEQAEDGAAANETAGTESADQTDEDDFLSDDFLRGDTDTAEDDFLSEDFQEAAEEEAPPERGAYYWGFEVPVDVLLLRPLAALDVAVGMNLFCITSVAIAVPTGVESVVRSFIDGELYWSNGDFQQAWQQTVLDPGEYLWRRPLGQLSSY